MKERSILIPIIFIFLFSCKKSSPNTDGNTTSKDSVITTVAGNGTWGFSGDGGQANTAQLSTYSKRVYVDGYDNIYISDGGNNRIRKVNSSGIITTIAGTGSNGFSGDGGQATSAQISSPQAITMDASGNIYFADAGNDRIRKIALSGIITTVAGNGKKYSANYGDGGPATADTVDIHLPQDIVIDKDGNLIIADWAHHRIRKVNATTGLISTIAGIGLHSSGDGGLAKNANVPYPTGLAIDANGNIFIASENRIRKINTAGIITTVAGTGNNGISGNGGLATAANILPEGIAINNIGEIIMAEYDPGVIRKVSINGIISVVAGGGYVLGDNGNPRLAKLVHSSGVATDALGNIFIADYGDRRIRKISLK
jgi:trimeric autotransporter adhesin